MNLFKSLTSILIGLSMLCIWVLLYVSNQIPELTSEPYRIWFHITAEVITALLLLVGGIMLLAKKRMAQKVFLFATGALFYTLIASQGYYLEKGDLLMVLLFTGILALTLFFVINELFYKKRS